MTQNYPPVGFHFTVDFDDEVTEQENENSFQSVSGLNVEMETESYVEGGENRFEHTLPLRSSYSNVVLQRGLLKDSELIEWCRDTFENMKVKPANLLISLLDKEHNPLVTWKLKHAWPVKWEVSDFDAGESALVVESIELSYQYFTVE